MFINHIFYLSVFLCIPCFTFSMEIDEANLKRDREELSGDSISAQETKKPKIANFENPLITKIKKNIHNINPIIIGALLSTDDACALTKEEKNALFEHAEQCKNTILQMCRLGQTFTNNADDQSIKEKFSYDTEYKNTKKITNYLLAFKFLKKLTFPQALFNPRPYCATDLRPKLDTVLEAIIMNEQEKISACCFHITLFNVAQALVNQKNEGVTVEVLTNQKQGEHNPVLHALIHLIENNIPVSYPKTANKDFETNHHKFLVFKNNIHDKSLLWMGSYNLTGHTNENSWEDVVLLDDKDVIQEYLNRFEEIKQISHPLTLDDLQKIKTNPSGFVLKINNVPKKI